MRILYIITKATYGGAQTHIRQCSEYMLKNGHTVAVMAGPNNGEGLEGDLKELKIKFYSNKFFINSFNPINGILSILKTRKILRDFNPDLISCHSSYAGFWGRLAVMNRIPVIFTAHGWGFTQGSNFFRAQLIKISEKIVSSLCKKIICVSENDKNLAIKYNVAPKNKLIVIHNGVEIKYTINKPKKIFELKNKIPIVFVGRLVDGKTPEKLLEAFIMLPSNLKNNTHIYIIGDGKKRKIIENIIYFNNLQNRVSLIGELPREDVLSFLSDLINSSIDNIGIFTLISDYEGFPRSILEAMRFGYAVVASNVGGVKEVVTEDVGILLKENNEKTIENILEFLLNNKNKIKEFGYNSQNKILNQFSLDKMLNETERVYKSII